MADTSESKSAGFLPFAIAVVAISVVGLGAGFGFSMLVLHSDPTGVAAAEPKPVATELEPESKTAAEAEPQPLSHSVETEGNQPKAALQEDEIAMDSDTVLTPFPPITTNLAEPKSVWVRLEGSLVVKKSRETRPDELAQSAAPRIMAFLRTTKLTDIQGANGLSALSSDLNEVVRSSSDGQILAILLSGFIVE
jgi:flagellar protein FliL